VLPIGGAAAGWVVAAIVRTAVLGRLARLAASTERRIDDIVLASLRGPMVIWGALLGLQFAMNLTEYEPRVVSSVRMLVIVIVIMSVSWTLGRIAAAALQEPHATGTALPSARILSTAAKAAVIIVGALVALQTIGVSVAPVLTALGVGGLAVGLALQDTLANLFAGFQILISRQVRPGDFVKLSSGEEGFVEDITWRNTTIRQLPNNIVIVPNATLAQSITYNYNQPDAQQAVLVQVGVGYESDLKHVEAVTIDVARSVHRDVTGAVPDFDPFVRFHTFGDSSINFSVIMRGTSFVDQYLMKHEFVKRLHVRYQAEGINIPFPQRTLHFENAPSAP
jgi:small-conductance mechanosensitive channel